MKQVIMRLVSAVFSVVMTVACTTKVKTEAPIFPLEATKINSDLFMGMPLVIKLFPGDSVLWISDFRTDPMIAGVHKETGEVLCQLARKGHGPSELLPPVHVFSDGSDMYLYDRNRFKLYRRIVSAGSATTDESLEEIVSFGNGYSLVYRLTDSTYIGTGFFEKRFSVTDSTGKELCQTCELPQYWSAERSFPLRVRSMYHQALWWGWHPDTSCFVAATSDVLTAYRVGKNAIEEIFQLPLHDYTYRYDNGEFVSTQSYPDVPVGILDVACDSEYIYVLYDRSTQEEDGQKWNSVIRVYDWTGEWVKTYVPDVDLTMMTIDVSGRVIYGISTDEEPAIWRLSLPDGE